MNLKKLISSVAGWYVHGPLVSPNSLCPQTCLTLDLVSIPLPSPYTLFLHIHRRDTAVVRKGG